METLEFNKIIKYIVGNCIRLKDKHTEEKNLQIDYLCIFSRSQKEYLELTKLASCIGKIVDETKTGPVFKFNVPFQTIAGKAKVLKIRMPDKTRLERGDVDFITNYESFKKKYLDNKNFTLVKRERFEMLELKDSNFEVLVYFSSTPPSKLLGVS